MGRSTAKIVLAEDVSLFQHATAALYETIDLICPPDLRSFVVANQAHMRLWHETLETHARHGHNVRNTAAALHVHTNTVYYRLGQISAASGRDLTSLSDFTDVWIALTYWERIHAHESAAVNALG